MLCASGLCHPGWEWHGGAGAALRVASFFLRLCQDARLSTTASLTPAHCMRWRHKDRERLYFQPPTPHTRTDTHTDTHTRRHTHRRADTHTHTHLGSLPHRRRYTPITIFGPRYEIVVGLFPFLFFSLSYKHIHTHSCTQLY